jgi:hypothetical protein
MLKPFPLGRVVSSNLDARAPGRLKPDA